MDVITDESSDRSDDIQSTKSKDIILIEGLATGSGRSGRQAYRNGQPLSLFLAYPGFLSGPVDLGHATSWSDGDAKVEKDMNPKSKVHWKSGWTG